MANKADIERVNLKTPKAEFLSYFTKKKKNKVIKFVFTSPTKKAIPEFI